MLICFHSLVLNDVVSSPYGLSMYVNCRSRWLRDLRHGSATARWRGLGFLIPLRAWRYPLENVVYCQIEVSAPG